jgi:hypothetical protein
MSRRPLRTHGRLVAIGLSLLLLLGATGGSGTSTEEVDKRCPLAGPTDEEFLADDESGNFNAVMLEEGLTFCASGGKWTTGIQEADGKTTLLEYLGPFTPPPGTGQGTAVSYYVIYDAAEPDYELVWITEPADTEVGERVPGAVTDTFPQVALVQVVVGGTIPSRLDGVAINVELKPDSTPSLLSGTLVATTDDGIATFGNLRVSMSGEDYRLVATSLATPDEAVESSEFTVWDLQCEGEAGDPCGDTFAPPPGAPGAGDYSIELSGLGNGDGGGFLVGFTVSGGQDCTNPVDKQGRPISISRIPAPFTIEGVGFADGSKLLTIRVKEAYDKTFFNNNGVSKYEICTQPLPPNTMSFLDKFTGKTVDGLESQNTQVSGWLPNCSRTVGAPCVSSRTKDPVNSDPLIQIRWGSTFMKR